MRTLFPVSTLLLSLFVAGRADAFTLRQSADGDNVRWTVPSVDVTVDSSVSELGSGADDALTHAFAAWAAVPNAHPPTVTLHPGAVDALGYQPGATNMSTVRYLPEGTPLAGIALSITILTYDDAGSLVDADVILNGAADRVFAVLPPEGDSSSQSYDLQNVLTHEAGHFFGFGEEPAYLTATMYPYSNRGEVNKRNLTATDVQGLQTLYPHPLTQTTACRVAAPGAPVEAGVVACGLAALAALAFARRLQKRRPLETGHRAERLFAFGALGALVLSPLANVQSSASTTASPADAIAHVASASAHWEGGLVVTTLNLEVEDCSSGACGRTPLSVEVFGGERDGFTQIIDGRRVPRAGEHFSLATKDGALAWSSELPIRH